MVGWLGSGARLVGQFLRNSGVLTQPADALHRRLPRDRAPLRAAIRSRSVGFTVLHACRRARHGRVVPPLALARASFITVLVLLDGGFLAARRRPCGSVRGYGFKADAIFLAVGRARRALLFLAASSGQEQCDGAMGSPPTPIRGRGRRAPPSWRDPALRDTAAPVLIGPFGAVSLRTGSRHAALACGSRRALARRHFVAVASEVTPVALVLDRWEPSTAGSRRGFDLGAVRLTRTHLELGSRNPESESRIGMGWGWCLRSAVGCLVGSALDRVRLCPGSVAVGAASSLVQIGRAWAKGITRSASIDQAMQLLWLRSVRALVGLSSRTCLAVVTLVGGVHVCGIAPFGFLGGRHL